jgi:hypothetical protein
LYIRNEVSKRGLRCRLNSGKNIKEQLKPEYAKHDTYRADRNICSIPCDPSVAVAVGKLAAVIELFRT